jgi:protein-L-isoaspartate(D-aspartate) O-methyltransferase
MIDFAKLRAHMIDSQLRTNDVHDSRLLAAIGAIPRERFVPTARRSIAYMSEAIEIASNRYLMDPRSFGKLFQLAEIGEGDIVLIVAVGSGYSAAVASKLASTVVALEENHELFGQSSQVATELGLDNVAVVSGQLSAGYPRQGPYDVILFDGGVEEVPESIFAQLKDGGRLAVILRKGPLGKGQLFVKSRAGISRRVAFDATVPLLPGFQAQPGFVF